MRQATQADRHRYGQQPLVVIFNIAYEQNNISIIDKRIQQTQRILLVTIATLVAFMNVRTCRIASTIADAVVVVADIVSVVLVVVASKVEENGCGCGFRSFTNFCRATKKKIIPSSQCTHLHKRGNLITCSVHVGDVTFYPWDISQCCCHGGRLTRPEQHTFLVPDRQLRSHRAQTVAR